MSLKKLLSTLKIDVRYPSELSADLISSISSTTPISERSIIACVARGLPCALFGARLGRGPSCNCPFSPMYFRPASVPMTGSLYRTAIRVFFAME